MRRGGTWWWRRKATLAAGKVPLAFPLRTADFKKSRSIALRLGIALEAVAIAAGRYHETVIELRAAQSLAGQRLTEAALATYLSGGAYDRHLARMRQRVRGAAQ